MKRNSVFVTRPFGSIGAFSGGWGLEPMEGGAFFGGWGQEGFGVGNFLWGGDFSGSQIPAPGAIPFSQIPPLPGGGYAGQRIERRIIDCKSLCLK